MKPFKQQLGWKKFMEVANPHSKHDSVMFPFILLLAAASFLACCIFILGPLYLTSKRYQAAHRIWPDFEIDMEKLAARLQSEELVA